MFAIDFLVIMFLQKQTFDFNFNFDLKDLLNKNYLNFVNGKVY